MSGAVRSRSAFSCRPTEESSATAPGTRRRWEDRAASTAHRSRSSGGSVSLLRGRAPRAGSRRAERRAGTCPKTPCRTRYLARRDRSATVPVAHPLLIGLAEQDSEFDRVFLDTFRLVVLRGQNPRVVLEHEAETLNRLMTETGAPCWQPDPSSTGACQ